MSAALEAAVREIARQQAARQAELDGLHRQVARLTAERDAARRDADMWHDEAHAWRTKALGLTAPVPSSITRVIELPLTQEDPK